MPLRIRGHIKYPAKQAAPKVESTQPAVVKYWTDQDDAYLMKCYPTEGSGPVSIALGRTRGAVMARAAVLRLTAPNFMPRT